MNTTSLEFWGYDGSGLHVDVATGAVVGEWAPIPGRAETRLDFLLPAELCRCCARVLLTSGSKFSIWFCDPCRDRARDLNAAAGRCVIPQGRHTLVNGVGLKPARQWKGDDLERFVDDARSVWDSMGLTERWAHEIVRRNCAALGLEAQPTVALGEYLDAAHDNGIAQREAFAQMLEWWAGQ